MSNLNILYEDNHIIVVVKPINILSQADDTGDMDMLTIIKKYLKDKYHKPGNVYLGLVHRLDRVVGGIMVFAKTSKAASRLSEEVRTNKVNKEYLAIVHGKIKEEGILIDYLEKTSDFSTIISNETKGKLAKLSYKRLEYDEDNDLSLVIIKLETGRHHQIRVQFSSRGYALLGDNRYGNDQEKEIGLFAYKLSFIHPTLKNELSFTYYPTSKNFMKFNYIKSVNIE